MDTRRLWPDGTLWRFGWLFYITEVMTPNFPLLRRTACVAIAAACVGGSAVAAPPPLRAPNVVPISDTLVTSGQPGAESLTHLRELGFAAVIYLAPSTVPDAVPGEAEIVRGQGLEFVHIPVAFGKPTEADFETFVAAMNRLHGSKVLVHCQVNMRASSFVFLYRAVVAKENPDKAYEAVTRVWAPHGPWKQLLVAQLRKANIGFEPD